MKAEVQGEDGLKVFEEAEIPAVNSPPQLVTRQLPGQPIMLREDWGKVKPDRFWPWGHQAQMSREQAPF